MFTGHRERLQLPGTSFPLQWWSLIHKPVPIGEALRIPKAKEALDAEWDKLEKTLKAWQVITVMEKSEVIRLAKQENKKVHFGSLMQLCHVKNAQLDSSQWKYKGRIVFRGDVVKDEDGHFAVFSEQGTSSSHLMAARFVDAVSRMPGMLGQDADATGAYTQIPLGRDCPDTWISLPRDRWPRSW